MSYLTVMGKTESSEREIKQFWNENFPNWPPAKYDWFYMQNPYGYAHTWFIKVVGMNHLIGMAAIFPRHLYVAGESVMAGITGDYGVNKNHRILGPALMMQKEIVAYCEAGHIDLLYGYPNKNSEPVQKRVGFSVVGHTVRLVKVLKSYEYLKNYTKIGVLAKLLAVPADLALWLFSGESYKFYKQKIFWKISKHFDCRYDELWEKSKNMYKILGEKTSLFLNWRYSSCPYFDYKIFEISSVKSNELLGYIVFHIIDGQMKISDMLSSPDKISILIKNFIRFARQERINKISLIYMGDDKIIRNFQHFGFSLREAERRIVVYTNKKCESPAIHDKNNWFLMEGDND